MEKSVKGIKKLSFFTKIISFLIDFQEQWDSFFNQFNLNQQIEQIQ